MSEAATRWLHKPVRRNAAAPFDHPTLPKAGGYQLSQSAWKPAAFAALLSDDVKQVSLKNALGSFSEVAETENYKWPYAALLPDVLKHFDLPDVYRSLEEKKLSSLEPWGAVNGMD